MVLSFERNNQPHFVGIIVPAMQKNIANQTTVIIVLIAAVLLGCAVPAFLTSNQKKPAVTPKKPLAVDISWQIPPCDISAMSFTPGGRFICIIDRTGKLSVYNSNGQTKYTVQIQDIDRIVLSPDGAFAMVYSFKDPSDFTVTFLNDKGVAFWKQDVASSIWSADSCVIDGGARFVVGTGKRSVYVFDISKNNWRYRSWRAPGTVVSIDVDSQGQQVLLGTWQESACACADISGRMLWKHSAEPSNLQTVQGLNEDDRITVCSIPNRRGADGEFQLADSEGEPIWKAAISASDRTRVVCSANGRYMCVGHIDRIEHKGKSVIEKHADLYDESGKCIWQQGSMFMQIEPLLVTGSGEVLLADQKGSMFIAKRDGSIESCGKLPGPVIRSERSDNGLALIVQCSNKTICKIDVSQ